MEIRFGVVGEILGGIYAGWYIFIQQYHDSESTLVHTSTHPQIAVLNFVSYDNWLRNRASLEVSLEHWGITKINWREDLESNLPPYAD